MELREFVSETLTQIIAGVKDAQEATIDTGAVISPGEFYIRPPESKRGPVNVHFAGPLQYVSFDVAVTKSDVEEKKGGLGVFFGPVGIGGQGKSETQDSAINKIQFSVPVAFTQGKPPKQQ